MSEETMKFLQVEDLNVIYTANGATVHAVNGVSFDLERGQTLGLVGETGAGKTTIAKAIMRILPDPPAKITGGSILLDGMEITALSEKEMLALRGKKAAMIFQDPMTALNPLMTVGDQIAEVVQLHNAGATKREAYKSAGDMLELVGIPRERFIEYPHQFSGGMKQRVVIAMALACDPELLLADEPTTALDVTIQAQVLELIQELRERFQTAMILITHDLGVVAETCDKVAIVYAGQIVECGSRQNIFKNPTHPYTLGLFGSLPGADGSTGKKGRLRPIEGMPPDPTQLPDGCAFSPRCPRAAECCRAQVPAMVEVEPGHFVRCLMWKGGARE